MPESKEHKTTATRIARLMGAEYNPRKGADIRMPGCTVEVETPDTVSASVKQLQGRRGEVYIAGTNREAVVKALKHTENTTIGVMDSWGNIVKPSSRGVLIDDA